MRGERERVSERERQTDRQRQSDRSDRDAECANFFLWQGRVATTFSIWYYLWTINTTTTKHRCGNVLLKNSCGQIYRFFLLHKTLHYNIISIFLWSFPFSSITIVRNANYIYEDRILLQICSLRDVPSSPWYNMIII